MAVLVIYQRKLGLQGLMLATIYHMAGINVDKGAQISTKIGTHRDGTYETYQPRCKVYHKTEEGTPQQET